jgi:hypothetical protein
LQNLNKKTVTHLSQYFSQSVIVTVEVDKGKKRKKADISQQKNERAERKQREKMYETRSLPPLSTSKLLN